MILPNINKTVTLNDVEIHAGSELAFRRFHACERHNILNRKVASRKTNQEISELGVLSEIAFCKMMNIYPDFSYHVRKGLADCVIDGVAIDIKTTNLSNGQLLVTPKKEIDGGIDLYVLMTGDRKNFTYKGWKKSKDVYNKNNLKDLGYGPTYVIKQQELSTTCQI